MHETDIYNSENLHAKMTTFKSCMLETSRRIVDIQKLIGPGSGAHPSDVTGVTPCHMAAPEPTLHKAAPNLFFL
jgi:hypothetical protein